MLTDEEFECAYEHLTYEMLWCLESVWFGYEAVTYARRLYRLLEQNGKIPSC